MKLPLIYNYLCYREFIRDYVAAKKTKKKEYSIQLLAEKSGFGSANHFQMILTGKRNLMLTHVHALASPLGLDFSELEYFEALVLFNQSDEPRTRLYYKRRLQRHSSRAPLQKTKISRSETIVGDPLTPAICVLAVILGRSCPEQQVAELLNQSVSKVTDILHSACEEQILTKNEDETYHLASRHLDYSDPATALTQKVFLRKQIEFSLQNFEATYNKGGKFYSLALTVSSERINEAHQELEKLIHSLSTKFDGPGVIDLVQLNLQFFPLVTNLQTGESST